MNRLYFSFDGSDEYFAKTTEIDNCDKAIITAIYPIIKNRKGIIDPPLTIEIGYQAPHDDVEYVAISQKQGGALQISERQSFKRGYTGFTDTQIERIFIENCSKVEYYGSIKELAQALVFNDDWFDKQQELKKQSAEEIKREIGVEFANKPQKIDEQIIDNSRIEYAPKEEASAELLKTIESEAPNVNDIPFNVMSDICDEILSTLKKKNDDYGNSYIKNIERFGKQAMLIPMFNKLDRLESLSKKENQNFESFEDSLKDLIGYCLMATEYLKRSK